MAPQPGGSTFPDAAAVPLADGRPDGHPEKVRQAGGAAGIYGMTIVQNREIPRPFPGFGDCRTDAAYRPAYTPGKAVLADGMQSWLL